MNTLIDRVASQERTVQRQSETRGAICWYGSILFLVVVGVVLPPLTIARWGWSGKIIDPPLLPSYILLGIAGLLLGIHGLLTHAGELLGGVLLAVVIALVSAELVPHVAAGCLAAAFALGLLVPIWAHGQSGD